MIKNLVGQRFGKLTVIRRADNDKVYGGVKRTTWLCKCDCGKEADIITSNLTNGVSTSCGCSQSQLEDLTGQRFGKIVVLGRADEDKFYGKKKVTTWKCQCDCGKIVNMVGNNLKRGLTTSCGSCVNNKKK
jgi:hypothetical protein